MRRFCSFCAAVLVFCTLAFSAQPYCGGELFSRDTFHFGRFDVRMRMAGGAGVISSFFLYYDNSYLGGNEPWREIDIESVGKTATFYQTNVITGNAAKRVTSEQNLNGPASLSANYYTYTIEWTPDSITWYLDGKLVRKTTNQQMIDCREKPMSLRFNTWISIEPSWAGAFNPATLPSYQFIHWIKYAAYTPKAGPGGSNFTPTWVEKFDALTLTKWGRGNWGFEGNMAEHSMANIVVKDNTCIICLTAADKTGFTGTVPPDNDVSVIENPQPGYRPAGHTNAYGISTVFTSMNRAFSKQSQAVRFVWYSVRGQAQRQGIAAAAGVSVAKKNHH